MPEWGLLLLLFAAIAIGYALGRIDRERKRRKKAENLSQEYFVGLNYLLNDQPDEAIETFIRALDITSESAETFETRITLGRLYGRRGEIERAIQVHQGLLAKPSLSYQQSLRVQLELARDYLSAGLLDRAEALLRDIAKAENSIRYDALKLLLDVYQQEKEWQRAIDVARQLLSRDEGYYRNRMTHFFCELAELSLQRREYHDARERLQQALQADRNSVRASLLMGAMEYEQANYRAANKALQRIAQQDPEFVSESVPLLVKVDRKLGRFQSISGYLNRCLKEHPSTAVMLAIAEGIHRSSGSNRASRFIVNQLVRRPSLKGLYGLIDLHLEQLEGSSRENLGLLANLVSRVIDSKPVYRCGQCGFSGKELHWQCPSCKEWGAVKPIRGIEGQ
ncbi:lipopolysaccharide assembly protein LapB [Aestuariirhabdus litorea]|uniref:Lipopolysaccharide assembly protein B n=1 Tax=Aestuariirhabdus litorea TaxID=2528527 RepID=A0A3P3VNA0_9GAMM|nr:lipopolysaccharide assembly protein LapB [Aestuariirhabdus litorea]RRJ84232.1 lipopolysaccharide assembly protein LapB [Aestuariirhabdus litorea]RWW97454.1 lipopolysaccharide assembly protein LapB [Endozoicomonadaceae bacterium GTF-13]